MAKKATAKDVLTDSRRNDGRADIAHYTEEAKRTLPTEKDEWRVSELAQALMSASQLVRKHWPAMNGIAAKSGKDVLAFTLAVESDRSQTPPEVKVSLSYSETYREKIEAFAPDPKQGELKMDES